MTIPVIVIYRNLERVAAVLSRADFDKASVAAMLYTVKGIVRLKKDWKRRALAEDILVYKWLDKQIH